MCTFRNPVEIGQLTKQQISRLGNGTYLQFSEVGNETSWKITKLNCLERLFRWIGCCYANTQLKSVSNRLVQEVELPELLRAKMFDLFERSYPSETNPFDRPEMVRLALEPSGAKEAVLPIEIPLNIEHSVNPPSLDLLQPIKIGTNVIRFVEEGSLDTHAELIYSFSPDQYYYKNELYVRQKQNSMPQIIPEIVRVAENQELPWSLGEKGDRWEIFEEVPENTHIQVGGRFTIEVAKIPLLIEDLEQSKADLKRSMKHHLASEMIQEIHSISFRMSGLLTNAFPREVFIQTALDAFAEIAYSDPEIKLKDLEIKLVFSPDDIAAKIAFLNAKILEEPEYFSELVEMPAALELEVLEEAPKGKLKRARIEDVALAPMEEEPQAPVRFLQRSRMPNPLEHFKRMRRMGAR